MRSSAAASTSQAATGNVDDLSGSAKHILAHALSHRTKKSYFSCWQRYVAYCKDSHCTPKLPMSDVQLVNFLAHLFSNGYSLSTTASHSSALSYLHKAMGFRDFGESFLLKQYFRGASNLKPATSDTRLPITYVMLQSIIEALPKVVKLYVHQIMFKAMCLLAFHGFLRIGEMCVKSSTLISNVIKRGDIVFQYVASKLAGLEITLQQFKHSTRPVTLFFPVHADCNMCAVTAINTYLSGTSHKSGPLFQFNDGQPVSYAFFNSHLKDCISFLGYDTKLYKSHSFRIGAATHATIQGYSEDDIRKMGRWKSNALQNYVRMPRISLQVSHTE
ncbi:MAG: hypothetical protein ABW185_11510 [Sedimenticola sp.]